MLLYIGLLFILIWVLLLGPGLPRILKMTRLTPNYSFKKRNEWPKVSIVVAACNEEKTIESGIHSLVELDYPNLEIVVVNDRSTDQTREIVEKLAKQDKRVKLLNITELPERWLGKNYAMYQGAKKASGEWILFTDADIVFHSEILKISIDYVLSKDLDHLTMAPTFITSSMLIKGMVMMTTFNFFVFYRPQFAGDKKSKSSMGLGAFNLVKKSVYEQIGTYQIIRHCVDDDIQLGRQIKRRGFSQDFALGFQLMKVEWYKSFKELRRGIEKNALPPLRYRILPMILAMIFLFCFYFFPFLGLVISEAAAERMLFSTIIVIMMLYIAFLDRFSRQGLVVSFFFPLYILLFFSVIGTGIFHIWKRKGINWRGTVYSLNMLREKE